MDGLLGKQLELTVSTQISSTKTQFLLQKTHQHNHNLIAILDIAFSFLLPLSLMLNQVDISPYPREYQVY